MKKIITILLSILLMLQCNIIAFASDNVTVLADSVSLSQTEPILIPIKIENNSGIMGFKMTVEYPVDKLDVKSVSRGEITAKGNFNSNLGINDGRFDVLWNNVDEIKNDGTLFVISVQAKTEIKKDTEIKLSFSQPDTFNEKYEDVVFDCKNIIISADYIKLTMQETTTQNGETTTQNGETTTKVPAPIDNSQIIDAVNTTLEQNGYENLKDVEDADDFIKDFNKNLETITGSDEHNVTDFDTIKSMYNSAYEGEFITETTNNIDSDTINSAVKETLDEFKVKSIDALDDKDKVKFVQKVEEKLKEQNPDTPNISKDLETDAALDIIEKLYDSTNAEQDEQQKNESNNSSKTIIIVVTAVVLVVLIAIVIIILNKKKLSNKDSQ
ncbi:MAG: hypothetical protein NC397_08110 [Clostridium sp.]|nr:hypothetical protein [Clostridium sp.]